MALDCKNYAVKGDPVSSELEGDKIAGALEDITKSIKFFY